MRGFVKVNSGATAVEFALVAPVFLLIVIGTMACGIGLWSSSAIHTVATEAARCIAIRSTACTSTQPDCSLGEDVCYVLGLAQERGLAGLAANDIAIERAATIGTASFTRVTITYTLDLAGYEMIISAAESFPNN